MARGGALSEERAFAEAVDCFACAYSMATNRRNVVSLIQEELGISDLQVGVVCVFVCTRACM